MKKQPIRKPLEALKNIENKNSHLAGNEFISPVDKQPSYPISFAQRRLWVLCQFEEQSIAYNMTGRFELDGSYDIEVFTKAINAVIERHEILRTVFRDDGTGEIHQWILSVEDLGFKIDYKDFRSNRNRKSLVEQYIAKDSRLAFDLEKGPLLRAALLQLEDNQYVFYFNMHHIIGDGWSMNVISRDVIKYYAAFMQGISVDLPALRVQYKDYTSWQLDQLQGESYQQHRQYWMERLSGELPVLDLPSSLVRPAVKTYRGQKMLTFLDHELTASLKAFSLANGGTLFMGLLASLKALFYRYTGERDLIVGSPIAGRDHVELEDQIGFYVNTLALRTHIEESDSFSSLFKKIKTNTLEAYDHQRYPFDKLVEDLELRREISRSAVFDVLLVLQNADKYAASNTQFGEEDLTAIENLGEAVSKFDISFDFKEVGGRLSLNVEYNADVYEQSMVERVIAHYRQLLSGLLHRPDIAISKVEYLSTEEKEELLVGFNSTKVDYPKDKCIHQLFEEQVENAPDNIAVVFENEKLTYSQLNERANQLGHFLQKKGVAAETIVGICIERSLEMLIGVLGIVKIGAAYVAIDPKHPTERINYILEDTKASTVLTSTKYNELFDRSANCQIVNMDTDCLKYEKESTAAVPVNLTSNSLCYILYTSGSTGEPRGVMVSHKNLSSRLQTEVDLLKLNNSVRSCLITNFIFDVSLLEIFLPLITGGTVVIPNDEAINQPRELLDLLSAEKVTLLQGTPSYFNFLIDQLEASDGDRLSLKTICLGGESLNNTLVKKMKSKLGRVQINNHYGPTETTIDAIVLEDVHTFNTNIIGKPIVNTKAYITDASGGMVPIGVQGEICIGGQGVTMGYLNNPELTDAKFVDDPFMEGGKLYKTGDVGKWLPDGNIVFVGRKDNQIKLRGFRIEIGEIEAALDQCEEVNQCVVVLKEDQGGNKILVAYILPEEKKIDRDHIITYLKTKIPNYMIPAFLVEVQEIPRTLNGKVNLHALPDTDNLITSQYVAPRNKIETQLVEIWQEVLGRDRIGVKEDFFDLGGNSLNAISIISRLRKEHNFEIKPKEFFTKLTVEHLADYLESIQMMHRQSNKVVETDDELIF